MAWVDDPSKHFQSDYFSKSSGSGSSTFDGNSAMQPDLVWAKSQGSNSHELWDSTRGVNSTIFPDATEIQDTATGRLSSFDSDGISWGTAGNLNTGDTFNIWGWKANGGTTSTNTDGDINSTVQVNSDAGFSIVKYSPSNTTARGIGHGLGTTPGFIITRNYTRGENWRVWWHNRVSTGSNYGSFTLDSSAEFNYNTVLHGTANSTVFNVGTDWSVNGNYSYISYCFHDVNGFSKFGWYYGNGNSGGTYVYTGFKPRFIIIKKYSDSHSWFMYDTLANKFNVVDGVYKADLPNSFASDSAHKIDVMSNGFRLRTTSSSLNTNGANYAFAAWAERPYVTSSGVPTVAR
tara:strand:+ start:1439 stop:2479 length:1041 start_codon:yes stop_codon:yes gene_type:complete